MRFETCFKCIIRHVYSYLSDKHKIINIFSCLSEFVTCSERFIIQSERSISQLWNTIGRSNLEYMFIRHSYTQIVNNVTLE